MNLNPMAAANQRKINYHVDEQRARKIFRKIAPALLVWLAGNGSDRKTCFTVR